MAWVSLDRYDDDPAILLTLLASAYARVSPGNGDLVADMGGLCVDALGRAALDNQRRRIRWACTRQHRRASAILTRLPG